MRQELQRSSRRQSLCWLGLLSLGACKSESAGARSEATPRAAATAAATPAAAPREALVVFAAASLRDAFGSLKTELIKTHGKLELTFNFAGTQDLRAQLELGAAVDVFASADLETMKELEAASRVRKPVVFARNEPVIVVAKERAGAVAGLADLPRLDKLVIGVPSVPIGRYTAQILSNANQTLGADFSSKVEKKIASRELDVRQVLAKVTLGEADAGIVYRTDASSAKDQVAVVSIPADVNVIAEYPIAVVSAAPHAALADEWVKLVLSTAGQELLRKAGFLAPAGTLVQ
jgi:molybdate transport system substrate-binding protein